MDRSNETPPPGAAQQVVLPPDAIGITASAALSGRGPRVVLAIHTEHGPFAVSLPVDRAEATANAIRQMAFSARTGLSVAEGNGKTP